MEKDEEEQPNRMYWRRVGVNRVNGHFIGLNSYKCNCRYPDSDHCFFSFRRINHMALKPFALILCLHVADHHVTNTNSEPRGVSRRGGEGAAGRGL